MRLVFPWKKERGAAFEKEKLHRGKKHHTVQRYKKGEIENNKEEESEGLLLKGQLRW